MPKGSKPTKPTEPEVDPDEDEVEDSPAASMPKPGKKKAPKASDAAASKPGAAAEKPKKKTKKEPEPEPESEHEDEEPEAGEEEEGDEEEEGGEANDHKARLRESRRRKKAKLVGYRSLARTAGYVDRIKDDVQTTAGPDGLCSLLSNADAKRLMRFVPATADAVSFSLEEYEQRHALFAKGVPLSTARETQARCDAVLRAIMNQAVQRTAESGKKTVTASTVASVLRPYAEKMEFTAVAPPLGLVRYAQKEGVISTLESDKEAKQEEKKTSNKTKKIAEEWRSAEEARRAAKRAKA